ncbi:MAG TPA: beta-propeller domain-containing protein, partial [Pirellulaceae bacterium]|nr:beta-propeller domain-containing protein [Pirellulaceae bacterium]
YATGGMLGEDGEPIMYTLGGGLIDGETEQLYRTQTSTVGCVYETRDEWMARIGADIDPSIYRQLPHFTSNNGSGEFERAGLLYEPSDVVMPVSANARQLMTVTSFDVDDDHAGPLFAQGVVTGWNSTIYASHDHLVLAENEYSYDGMSQKTSLLMMDWDTETGRVWVSSSGKVDGYVNGRFSIDEFDGTLRVVATESGWTGERFQTDHTLHVFKQIGTSLDEIGSVTGFGENETVRSVRFFGDRAFVVTAVTTDPLFAIDLSDPTQPKVAGELVLPGFSGYLQMLDGTHLLGIGQEPGESGMWVQKASLFDVADLSNPTELGKITLQTGASSLAQWDSHALTWLPDEHLLAIPVTNGSYVMVTTEEGFEIPQSSFTEGLMVLDINLLPTESLLPEIRVVAEIPHDSPVLRSVHLGDYLVSIAEDEVKAMPITDPATVAGQLDLPEPGPGDPGSGYAVDSWGWFFPGLVHPILYNFLPEPAVAGESPNAQVTDLVRNAMSDLAQRLGIDEGVIRLISTEATEWLDGNLGLTEVDPENPPTPVDGVQVVLEVGARKYLFHANDTGAVGLASDDFEFGESESPEWHNVDQPADVTADGFITPHDALAIIDELNSTGARMLRSQRPIGAIGAEGEAGFRPRFFWDVNGDRYVSPSDALWVINRLNADSGSSEDAGDAAIDAGASSRMAIWAGDGTEGSGDYFPSDPDVIDVGAGDEFAPKLIAPIFIKPIDDNSLGDQYVGDEYVGDEFTGDVSDESSEKKVDLVDDSSSEIDYATIVAEEKDASLGIDDFVQDTTPESDPALV